MVFFTRSFRYERLKSFTKQFLILFFWKVFHDAAASGRVAVHDWQKCFVLLNTFGVEEKKLILLSVNVCVRVRLCFYKLLYRNGPLLN